MARPTDLLIVTDATGSMSYYLQSLCDSIPEIIHISELTGCFERIAVIAYHDYDNHGIVNEWSGWYHTKQIGQHALFLDGEGEANDAFAGANHDTTSLAGLLKFVNGLRPTGGGDNPEATKSGLALAYSKLRADAETIVLLYTDAPPHTARSGGSHYLREKLMLTFDDTEDDGTVLATGIDAGWIKNEMRNRAAALLPPYGVSDFKFADWVSAANTLQPRARVFCMAENVVYDKTMTMYTYLSARTGGASFQVASDSKPAEITAFSVALVLAVMGVTNHESESKGNGGHTELEKLGAAGWRSFQTWALASGITQGWALLSYHDTAGIDFLADEADKRADQYLFTKDNLRLDPLEDEPSVADLYKHLPVTSAMTSLALDPAITDPAKRYKADALYRSFVTSKLEEILKDNAAAVTRNPVFGALWRAVCSDRQNDARARLLDLFSSGIDRIQNRYENEMAKAWLANSYDYVGDILAILDAVPEHDRFPCVYLDPTQDFSIGADAEDDDGDAISSAPAALTREDLLEIARSCDGRILRRIGRVLTRLTYAASAADLPQHIKTAVAANVRDPAEPGFLSLVPLALATKEHGRNFWRILLHTIVPGTFVSARPAALVAALSLRMGIAPLRDVADYELVLASNVWNNLDIPETWNASCLNLLLAADRDYTARVAAGTSKTVEVAAETDGVRVAVEGVVLSDVDRKLFATLVDYKHLESNLVSTLTARVGWTPAKTKALMGPTAVCRVCTFPRSVTMMAADNVCGLCCMYDGDDPAKKTTTRKPDEAAQMVRANVSATDSDTTRLWWVECGVRQCRAQYVVYNPDLLNARPKCWYCRRDGLSAGVVKASSQSKPSSAPTVECTTCLSRILWPEAYRPEGFSTSSYECPACVSGAFKTVVDIDVTARALEAENGLAWLLRNDGNKIAKPFTDRSVFHTAKTAGIDGLADSVKVFPLATEAYAELQLTLDGKLVRNTPALVDELRAWVSGRRAQGESCSLCFSTFYGARSRNQKLRRACGRTGCAQRVCGDCFRGWYGINSRGRLLNLAALSCPFCRRQPAPAAIASVGNNMQTLGNLREAVANAGTWVYGWCEDCGTAKAYAERVCAQQVDGAAEHLQNWRCEECAARRTSASGGGGVEARIKACPQCKTPTEKTGGCDHIACVVPGCGAHWCFFCGEAVSSTGIYKHMSEEHGGWFDGGDGYDDDGYGDDGSDADE
ncbi:dihydroxyacid dehydratase [Ophiostoma piceae UAMH 11346]|uniref:RBR-type E3 ubiquitin transferase n=1 Tax=Ophiostoma piceae (strain UAMH 11346) TaxID=1262450 RepID=S3C892_OPHP1|nr:dihydroxyacid dehydratase [Ophiostoma piceae UAMH 11346]